MNILDVRVAKKALDYASINFDNKEDYVARDKSQAFAKKYNLSDTDLAAYRGAAFLPPQYANPIKFNVLDKIWAKKTGVDTGGMPTTMGERFSIKNLIDEDPDLQVSYLKSKNYNARINENGELEAAKSGEPFEPVDSSQWEFNDLFDVIGDGINTVLTGLATGGKLIPGSGKGGLASGGYEFAKQSVAKAMGLRPDINKERIAEKTALGAVLPLLPIAVGRIPKETAAKWKATPRSNVEEIVAAGEKIGAEPTLGQKTSNIDVQMLENARVNAAPNIYNAQLKNTVSQNIAATDAYAADQLLDNRLRRATSDVAGDVQNKLVQKLTAKRNRAEELYDSVARNLDRPGYDVNTNSILNSLDNLEQGFSYQSGFPSNPEAIKWLREKRLEAENIRSINDLRKFGKNLRKDGIKYRESNSELSAAAKTLASESKTLIDDTFTTILDQWEATLRPNGPGGLLRTDTKTDQFLNFIKKNRNDLREANNLYRQVNEEADAILKKPGEQTKGSAKTKISKIENQSVEDTFKSVLAANDIKKAKWMEANFPEETAMVRGSIINEIFENAASQRAGRGDKSFGSKVNQAIKKMPVSKKQILFGKDGVEKAKILSTWFASMPSEVNPRGSGARGSFFDFSKMIGNHAGSAINLFRYKMAEWGALNKTVSAFGKAFDNAITRGATKYAGEQILIPMTSTPASDENRLK